MSAILFYLQRICWQSSTVFVQRIKSPSNQLPAAAAHKVEWNSTILVPYDRFRFIVEYNWNTNKWNHGGQDDQKYVTPGIVWDFQECGNSASGVRSA
ncbi:MAG: hypothetical protein DMG14_28980 [Acidobacteria bacterium]|nr:MAG: hypothetical protein DMG14_28980 [Acidobacteriota bacterium]